MTVVHQAYVVDTIGEVAGPCSGPCAGPCVGCNATLGEWYDPRDPDSVWQRGAEEIKRRAAEAYAAAKARASKIPFPSLPSLPDPVPPTLDVVGPSGWGRYVLPVGLLVVLGTAGVLVLRRTSHASRARRIRPT